MNKNDRNLMLVFILFIILLSSSVYYYTYSIKILREEYDKKIFNLNQEISANFIALKKSLENQIYVLGSNLSSQIGLIDTNLKNFKKQNQMEITTLTNLIDEIEQQSNIKLNELKGELKDIQIRSADFSAIIDNVLQSVVSITTNFGLGSGVIINEEGFIVTNLHVISGASTIRVTTYSGKTYNVAAIAGYDEIADIAVLKINAPSLKALGFGNSNEVKVGEKVIAAGNPAGLAFTVTEGIVSAIRLGSNNIKYIQTDVPINPGNSGGPLVNSKSEIVGINDFKVGGFESLGFAISSNDVKSRVDTIISDYKAQQQNQ